MTIADDVKTVVNAIIGITTTLPGGVYTYEDIKRLGINRDMDDDLYDSTTGLLKNCCVIKERGQTGDGGARDIGVASYRQVVEVWLYADGDSTYDTLETVQASIFTALDEQMIGSSNLILRWFANPIKGKDPALDNALVLRSDYGLNTLL